MCFTIVYPQDDILDLETIDNLKDNKYRLYTYMICFS